MNDYLREIKAASIDATGLSVELKDGFSFIMPLSFYPTLLLATVRAARLSKLDRAVGGVMS